MYKYLSARIFCSVSWLQFSPFPCFLLKKRCLEKFSSCRREFPSIRHHGKWCIQRKGQGQGQGGVQQRPPQEEVYYHDYAFDKDVKEGTGGHQIAKYENSKPKVHADEIIGCFSTANANGELLTPPGLLYRLVNHRTNQWYFYNDTKDYNMVITGYFGPQNVMRALGEAKMWREMPSGLLIIELIVQPLKTEPYLEGMIQDGFDLRFKALPI